MTCSVRGERALPTASGQPACVSMYCRRARETPSAATGVPFGLKIAQNWGICVHVPCRGTLSARREYSAIGSSGTYRSCSHRVIGARSQGSARSRPIGAALRADGAAIMAAQKEQLAQVRPATLVARQLPGTQSTSPAGMAAPGEVVPANTPLM